MFYRNNILIENTTDDLHKTTSDYVKTEIYPKVISKVKDEIAKFPPNIQKIFKPLSFRAGFVDNDNGLFHYPIIYVNPFIVFPNLKGHKYEEVKKDPEYKEYDKYRMQLADAIADYCMNNEKLIHGTDMAGLEESDAHITIDISKAKKFFSNK